MSNYPYIIEFDVLLVEDLDYQYIMKALQETSPVFSSKYDLTLNEKEIIVYSNLVFLELFCNDLKIKMLSNYKLKINDIYPTCIKFRAALKEFSFDEICYILENYKIKSDDIINYFNVNLENSNPQLLCSLINHMVKFNNNYFARSIILMDNTVLLNKLILYKVIELNKDLVILNLENRNIKNLSYLAENHNQFLSSTQIRPIIKRFILINQNRTDINFVKFLQELIIKN